MAEPLINKTVRLSRKQIAALEKEARLDDRPWTSLIRIAVDEMLEARRRRRSSSSTPLPSALGGSGIRNSQSLAPLPA